MCLWHPLHRVEVVVLLLPVVESLPLPPVGKAGERAEASGGSDQRRLAWRSG